MEKKIGIFVTHGMGNNKQSFADDMIKEISKRINNEGCNPDEVAWGICCWDEIMRPKGDALFKKMDKLGLRWEEVRKFCIAAFGDAVAYQESYYEHGEAYDLIHKCIFDTLTDLRASLGSDKPLIMMAHSLGCHIISNYIWDRQHGYDNHLYGGTDFFDLKTLTGIIMSGSNIPLFTLRYNQILSIDFPHQEFAFPKLRNMAKWQNYYDKDDPLGFPMKVLSPSYEKNVTEDIEVNVGSFLTCWNPICHLEYRIDDNFTKPVAKYITEILKVI